MPELLIASLLAVTLACPFPTFAHPKEFQMQIKPSPVPAEINAYESRLQALSQSADHIDLHEVRHAKQIADDLPQERQAALDLLQQQVSQHGTPEAKAFFSLNPVLEVSDVAAALSGENLPPEVKAKASDGIDLESLLRLTPLQQSKVLGLARQTLDYFQAQADASRSGVNPMSMKADDIRAFIEAYDRHQKTICETTGKPSVS